MSLRSFSNINRYLAVSALMLGVSGPVFAAAPAVQTYADQAAPAPIPDSAAYYNSPLAAGTLTLQDVLEAHKPAPAPTLPPINGMPSATATAPLLAPDASSSTGAMMSQGMKEVLQKVGASATVAAAPVAQGQPAPLVPPTIPAAAPVAADASGIQYQPGQEPRNLATGMPASATQTAATQAAAPVAPPAVAADAGTALPSAASAAPDTSPSMAGGGAAASGSCDQKPQKWEKTCGEAGYPATYLGKIVGETRIGCADGVLHDVWVTNTCAPPDSANGMTARTDGACGPASNDEFEKAPSANLCAQGIASPVSGDGPWTWACSGVNGGDAAACTAAKHITASNGSCGDANGVAVSSAPSDDLCRAGTATSVKGSGPWTWNCKGAGRGRSESCIAPVAGGSSVATAPVPAASVSESSAPSVPVAAPVAAVSSSGEKGDLCGAAAETLAYEAPEKDLCRVGTASAVNGDGPWSWSCTSNEGVTSSCRTLSLGGDASSDSAPAPAAAPVPAVSQNLPAAPFATAAPAPAKNTAHAAVAELACGLAASQPASQMPASDLCQGGKASAVRGSGPWHWSCSAKGQRKVSCETPQTLDGACGAANGAALQSAPFSGLCAAGTPSGIEGDGPWSWSCNGSGGGVTVSCAATMQGKASPVDGACGTSNNANLHQAPSAGLCDAGAPSAVSGDGPWTWSCSGSNGGSASSCSAAKIAAPRPPGPSVNGLCGAANGVTTPSQPTDGLCSSGSVSAVAGNGPWNWNCVGENGGMTVSCTAPLEPPAPIDGACGGANGVPTLTRPQGGLCAAGITGAVNGKGPWTWTCSGANGGVPASCVAPVAGKSAAMPSLMNPATDDEIAAAETPSSGLVTPHLPSNSNAIPPLDRKTIPSLTPSKAFAPAPTASPVPPVAAVSSAEAPGLAPDLPPGSQPLQPPSIGNSLPPVPVLQGDDQPHGGAIPGNHLTLDPTLSTVLFTRGSGNIDDNVVTTLDRLSTVLLNNQDVRISLIAYADNTGSTPRDARRLSLARALAVRDYLASKGVSESRVDIHAEGANSTSGYIDRVDVKVND